MTEPNTGVTRTLTVPQPAPTGWPRFRDWALRTWVLGWGAHARVVAPSALAEEILEQLEEARDGYAPRFLFESSPLRYEPPPQTRLPLRT